MKKLFLIPFLIFLYSFTWGQSAPLVVSTKVTINSVTVFTDPYTVTGVTNDVTSNWDASDIAAGDSLYLEDGSELRVYQVVSISSAVGTAFTIVINDLNNTGNLPVTGVGALYRGTTNYDFPVWTAGISETLQSMIDNRFKQRLDALLDVAGVEYITTDSFSTFISSKFESTTFSDIPTGSFVWRTTMGAKYQKISASSMSLRSSINGANASTVLNSSTNSLSFSSRLNAHVRMNTTGNPSAAIVNTPIYNSTSSVAVGSEYLIGVTAGTSNLTITWDTIYGLYDKDSGFSNLGTTYIPASSTVEYKFRVVVGAAETIRLQLVDNVGGGSDSVNLSYTPATGVVANTGGTGFTIPVATTSVIGLMPAVSGLGNPGGGVDPANDLLLLGDVSAGVISGPTVNTTVLAATLGTMGQGTQYPDNLNIKAFADSTDAKIGRARNGIGLDASQYKVLGGTYMNGHPSAFSAGRKLNWGNFLTYIGSNTDSTFFLLDLTNKRLALKSLLTTTADFFSMTNGSSYKVFQYGHDGSMELRSGLYDARWFQFINNSTFTNYKLGIGPYVNVTGNGAMGFGYSAVASGANAIRIGNEGSATGSASLSIGLSTTSTTSNAQSLGAFIANNTATSTILGQGRNSTETINATTKYTGLGIYTETPTVLAGGWTNSILAGTWARSNDTLTITGSLTIALSVGMPIYLEVTITNGAPVYITQVISSTVAKIDRTSGIGTSGTLIYSYETNGPFVVQDGLSTSSKIFFRVGRRGQMFLPQYATGTQFSGTVDKYLAINTAGDVIPATISAGCFNVKNYGAIGDSITNDYAAIQAAIDAAEAAGGGNVCFPDGQYSYSSQITINKSNITLSGSGKGTTEIINRVSETTGSTVGILIEGAIGDTVDNIVIKDLTIRGRANNSAAPYSHIFVDDYAQDTKFENVEFKWCRQYGLRYSATIEMPKTTVESCDFEEIATSNMPRVAGAALSGAVSEMSVRNCNFYNVGDTLHYHGFYPDAVGFGYDLLLENTTFRGAYSNFNLSSGSNEIKGSIRITGNTFASGSSTNIWKLAHPLIEGNVFYNNQLRVENDPEIIGNSFIDTTGTLTYFINDEGNTDNGTVKDNNFLGVSGSTVGIDIDGAGSARWDISNNTFRGIGIAIQIASDSNIIVSNDIYSNYSAASQIDILSGANVNLVKGNTIYSPSTTAIADAGISNTIICNQFSGGASSTANKACIVDGGNSTGGTIVVGTNDSNNLGVETSGTTRLFFGSSGRVYTNGSNVSDIILVAQDSARLEGDASYLELNTGFTRLNVAGTNMLAWNNTDRTGIQLVPDNTIGAYSLSNTDGSNYITITTTNAAPRMVLGSSEAGGAVGFQGIRYEDVQAITSSGSFTATKSTITVNLASTATVTADVTGWPSSASVGSVFTIINTDAIGAGVDVTVSLTGATWHSGVDPVLTPGQSINAKLINGVLYPL